MKVRDKALQHEFDKQKLDLRLQAHYTQLHQYDDCSGAGRIRKATKSEIRQAYKKIGKTAPTTPTPPKLGGDSKPKMKIVRKKVSNG